MKTRRRRLEKSDISLNDCVRVVLDNNYSRAAGARQNSYLDDSKYSAPQAPKKSGFWSKSRRFRLSAYTLPPPRGRGGHFPDWRIKPFIRQILAT